MTRPLSEACVFGTSDRRMTTVAQERGQWQVFDTAEMLADHAARWLCELACRSMERFAVCLSGGSTPQRLYQRLSGEACLARFPWDRVHWFWGDERFVPHNDARSNFRMARDAFLSRVPVRDDCVHPIPTQGLSAEQAAAAYENELQTFYGTRQLDGSRPLFDVTFLGVGEDGHTASLFPGSPALHENRRWAVAVSRQAQETRITVTYPVLDSSRNVVFLATGADKTRILASIRGGDAEAPAARVRPAGRLWWFLDRAAMPDLV